MDHTQIVEKSKKNKVRGKEVDLTTSILAEEKNTAPEKTFNLNGLNLTIDKSLSRFANDEFFIEHAKMVDKKFASNNPEK
jgi:hypothetical protein